MRAFRAGPGPCGRGRRAGSGGRRAGGRRRRHQYQGPHRDGWGITHDARLISTRGLDRLRAW